MNKRTVTVEEALELTEDSLYEYIDSIRWGHTTTCVVELDDKYWQFTLRFTSENGCSDEGEIDMYEVEPYSVTVTRWKLV